MSNLLEVRDLAVTFPGHRGSEPCAAVRGVSLAIARGETLGLVGESGAGKTTIGRAVLGLVRPSAGSIQFDGIDLGSMDQVGLQRFRRRAQIVFQDSMESLNPRMRIGDVLREVLMVHGTPRGSRPEEVRALLERVGLPPGIVELRPHELSAGQRQRVGIARALAVSPELVVLDEPVSALDVSVRAQVMNLLLTLQSELALTYLFISHDLAVVHHMSDRITVVHEGKVVEEGPPDVVLQQPAHPYTRALTDSALPWTVRM